MTIQPHPEYVGLLRGSLNLTNGAYVLEYLYQWNGRHYVVSLELCDTRTGVNVTVNMN